MVSQVNHQYQTQINTHPFWANIPARTSRRSQFWVPGERVAVKGKTYQRGPMYVAWEAPEHITKPYPVVLVHGGAMQGTEWLDTPDGRPGWAQRLVEAGYAVFVIDRPTQGRSPFHPDVIGAMGVPFPYEEGHEVFFPDAAAKTHTQFPFDPEDDAALDAFVAPFGPLPADLAFSQTMDADRIAQLLDRIGPAIIMTHSASGSDGWLVADRRPSLVAAIVTVEPMGPAFAKTPGIGTLSWGLTAAPVTYDPPRANPTEVQDADPASLRIPALAGIPVAVVSGETSVQSAYAPKIVAFLKDAGAAAELLHLPDFGVMGNGHGLIYEKNSDQALQPVLDWLDTHTVKAQEALNTSIGANADQERVTMLVTYKGLAGTRFDREYYKNQHLPLVLEAWKPYGLETAAALFPEGNDSDTIAICICNFRNGAAMAAALNSSESAGVMADVQHFTDAKPEQSLSKTIAKPV